MAAAMAGRRRGGALGVEAGDRVRDGVAGASAGGTGGLLVVVAGGDGQEHDGPGDLGGGCGLRPAELGQGLTLLRGEFAERVLLAAGHSDLPGVTEATDLNRGEGLMAMGEANDPLGLTEFNFSLNHDIDQEGNARLLRSPVLTRVGTVSLDGRVDAELVDAFVQSDSLGSM